MSYLRAIYKDYSLCADEFISGIDFLEQRAIVEAADCFRQACFTASSIDPFLRKYISYHGLSLVLQGNEQGLDLCRRAVEDISVDGDMYLNLARVELFYQHRRQAVQALQKGLYLDVLHEGLQIMQRQLGMRRRKALAFLPREHPVNQRIGKLLRRRAAD